MNSSQFYKSDEEIKQGFLQSNIKYWICSSGGTRSTYIRNLLWHPLHENDLPKNHTYKLSACHYHKTLFVPNIIGVYVFVDDIGISMSSQIQRNIFKGNFKKLCGKKYCNMNFSISNWITLIDKQIDHWTLYPSIDTYLINSDYLLNNIDLLIAEFNIPLELLNEKPFVKHRQTQEYHKDLINYSQDIERINKKLKYLPKFTKLKKL